MIPTQLSQRRYDTCLWSGAQANHPVVALQQLVSS